MSNVLNGVIPVLPTSFIIMSILIFLILILHLRENKIEPPISMPSTSSVSNEPKSEGMKREDQTNVPQGN